MERIVNTNKSILGLSSFMWGISPISLLDYQPLFASIITGKADNNLSERLPQANINYLYDGMDNQIDPFNSTDIPENSVAVVKITGPMVKYGNWYFWGADEIVTMLRYYDNHPNVIGIVLVNDSGGGQVSAVAPYRQFLANRKKPIVSIADISASANLWINSLTDYRFAENNISSMFGSIGVMANYTSYKKYYEDLGVVEHVVKSDYSDEKNLPFEKALEGDYKKLKVELLNPLAIKFIDDIKTDLPNLKADTPGLLKGKLFYAQESKDIGLIDAIGTIEDAVSKVRELAEIPEQARIFMNN